MGLSRTRIGREGVIPKRTLFLILISIVAFTAPGWAQAPAGGAKADTLGRDNPRSAVTGFLEACGNQDYQTASQYLDLSRYPAKTRAVQGPALAKQLEAILNSAPRFSVLRLSLAAEGNLADDNDPSREHVATITQNGQNFAIDLQRVTPQPGAPQIWLFSSDTVAVIPKITPSRATPLIERYLPAFMVTVEILETSLWKWAALVLAALLLFSLSRRLDRLLALVMKSFWGGRFEASNGLAWIRTLIQPARVLLCLAIFRIVVEVTEPSAVVRLYLGRAVELVLAWSFAWCVIRLVDLFLRRVETMLDANQQFASRSMLSLGRRLANFTIVVVAVLLLLSNWGYNTTTLVAGLGVGGIAIALAAQQTIANVFGGVSVIGDHPVRIGDFGKFGDYMGTVEDIGMRSTRIRTLSRTIVSVPNSSFAGLNLENLSERDKILFNPTLQVKRNPAGDQVPKLIDALRQALEKHKAVELVPTPVRLIGLASAGFNIEIFCYARTRDMDQFYVIQGELLLLIDEVLRASQVELA